MSVHAAFASNETLGLILCLTLGLIWWRNRSFVREIRHDTDRGWRSIQRLSVASIAALIAWGSLFDNWRQLTALPFRATRQWDSQRVQIDPPSADVRAATLALLAIAAVLTATLIARHLGGYVLQCILLLAALFAWLPFFVIGSRFTLNLAMGFDGSWTSPGDVGSYLGFAVLSWSFDIGLVVLSFAGIAALAALPVTLALDLLRLRRPRVTAEAQSFFNAIGGRTSP